MKLITRSGELKEFAHKIIDLFCGTGKLSFISNSIFDNMCDKKFEKVFDSHEDEFEGIRKDINCALYDTEPCYSHVANVADCGQEQLNSYQSSIDKLRRIASRLFDFVDRNKTKKKIKGILPESLRSVAKLLNAISENLLSNIILEISLLRQISRENVQRASDIRLALSL